MKQKMSYFVHRLCADILFRIKYRKICYHGKGQIEKSFSITCEDKAYIEVGQYIHFRSNTTLHALRGGKIIIGNNCFFNRGCSITAMDGVVIGNKCTFGNNAIIVDHDHDFRKGEGFVCSSIEIGDNVWVGANAVILRGSRIGNNCVIGAGTVVKGKIPDGHVAYQQREIVCKPK